MKYEYKADLDIIHHIMNVAENVPDVENQYHLSLQLEPRSKSTSTSSSGDTATIVDVKKEEESQQTPKKGIRKHFHMKSKNPENKVLVNKGKEKSRKRVQDSDSLALENLVVFQPMHLKGIDILPNLFLAGKFIVGLYLKISSL